MGREGCSRLVMSLKVDSVTVFLAMAAASCKMRLYSLVVASLKALGDGFTSSNALVWWSRSVVRVVPSGAWDGTYTHV